MSASLRPLTLGEFLAWESEQDGRYEFDGIQPVAMTGGTVAHARAVRRAVARLNAGLRAGCEAFGGDLKVLIGDRVRYPDVTVVCGPVAPGTDAVAPTVVFEVMSPSTALTDRRVKAAEYASVPAIMIYVMLQPETPAAWVLRRSRQFREEVLSGAESVLDLPEIGFSAPLGAFYTDTRA